VEHVRAWLEAQLDLIEEEAKTMAGNPPLGESARGSAPIFGRRTVLGSVEATDGCSISLRTRNDSDARRVGESRKIENLAT